MRQALQGLACAALLFSMGGCENGVQDMYDQQKYKPLSASELWRDGRAARPLEPGTIAFSGGALADSASGRSTQSETDAGTGFDTYSLQALERGRERYDIYCRPCHGAAGDGEGYITHRGYPNPPTFHADRLRGASDQYLFEVMSQGYGAMYPYADRITRRDRWALVGYIRALQRAQHASLDDVPAAERDRLMRASAP